MLCKRSTTPSIKTAGRYASLERCSRRSPSWRWRSPQLGLYAVMAQTVTRRRHEIGLRLAVGAGKSGILRLVFGKGLRQLAIGLAIGLPAAFLLTQVLMGAMDLPVVD